jgi:hypothetical protein
MTTPRTYNPAWPDSREARAQRQAKRQARLNEIAAGLGYASWRRLETAVINKDVEVEIKENVMSVQYYKRSVDAGHGIQYVEVVGGKITRQWLEGKGNHRYTGDGNTELVGKPVASMRGYGFKKVGRSENDRLLEASMTE